MNEFIMPLLGGVLIGLAVSLMLLFNGRVTGISGIIGSGLTTQKQEGSWRWAFILGLILSGGVIYQLKPELFVDQSDTGLGSAVIAGLLVGFGTLMGSGCTSGHGVCGLSRLSLRSLAATVIFMLAGILSVAFIRGLL